MDTDSLDEWREEHATVSRAYSSGAISFEMADRLHDAIDAKWWSTRRRVERQARANTDDTGPRGRRLIEWTCVDCGRPTQDTVCARCRQRQGIPLPGEGPHSDPYPKARSVRTLPGGAYTRSR